MKLGEIRELSVSDIDEQLKKSQIELVEMKMKFVSRQLDNPSLIGQKRKEIARLYTVQTQKLDEKGKETVVEKQDKEKKTKRVKKEISSKTVKKKTVKTKKTEQEV